MPDREDPIAARASRNRDVVRLEHLSPTSGAGEGTAIDLVSRLTSPRVGWIYVLSIVIAELVTTLVNPLLGVILHIGILGILLVHGAVLRESDLRSLVLALTVAPLIRIVSLTIPLGSFEPQLRFLIAAVPLLGTGIVLMRTVPLSWDQVSVRVRLSPGSIMRTLVIAASGIPLGVAEYQILEPDPMVLREDVWMIVTASLILIVATGFTEEFLFRGILQATATQLYGTPIGIGLVSVIFGALHIGHLSLLDVLFVTVVAIYFSYVVLKTRSILGVSFAHGLTNIMLFIVMPLLV